jgi:hypothetical protein
MKRRGWLLSAIALIVLATVLMLMSEQQKIELDPVEVNFPRRLRAEERTRMQSRRTLSPAPAPMAKNDKPAKPAMMRDPVLTAISAGSKSAMVFEANAIRHSPIGQLLLDCLANRGGRKNPLEQLKSEAGIDILQDLDRVAITDNGVVLSGHFANAKWNQLFKGQTSIESYGDQGKIYKLPDSTRGPAGFATWGDQMVVIGEDPQSAIGAIDRLEGRSVVENPLITEEQTYGEMYGVISAEQLLKMLPQDQAPLAERIRSAAERVELHVDTSKDVGIVAQIQGPDAARVEDLGKSLGGALSLARLQAKAQGQDELTEFLDLARVSPTDGQFQLEMALPIELLQKHLAFCRDENLREGQAAPETAPQANQTP